MAVTADEINDHSSTKDLLDALEKRFPNLDLWFDGDYQGRMMTMTDVIDILRGE